MKKNKFCVMLKCGHDGKIIKARKCAKAFTKCFNLHSKLAVGMALCPLKGVHLSRGMLY